MQLSIAQPFKVAQLMQQVIEIIYCTKGNNQIITDPSLRQPFMHIRKD